MKSGKTTLARLLNKYLDNTVRFAFGDEVRRQVAVGMGFSPADWRVCFTHHDKKDMRPILQAWGHGMRTIKGEEYWTRRLILRMKSHAEYQSKPTLYIVDDIRYDNELSNLRSLRGYGWKADFIRLNVKEETQIRRGASPEYLTHDSELQFYTVEETLSEDRDSKWDAVVDSNDDDTWELMYGVLEFLQANRYISEMQRIKAWSAYIADRNSESGGTTL
jgi:hypothetical protein